MFEYFYTEYKRVLDLYHAERFKLENLVHESTKPVPCKSWTKCYVYGEELSYMANLWTEINNYVQEINEKDGWEYSYIETEKVDVNKDPYDDYENLTNKYTVYATVKNTEDFRETEDYVKQHELVSELYNEVMELKNRIDSKLGG